MTESAVRLCYAHAISYTGDFCALCGPPGKAPLLPCGKLTTWAPRVSSVGVLVIPCQLVAGHGGEHVGIIPEAPGSVLRWAAEPEPAPERENP